MIYNIFIYNIGKLKEYEFCRSVDHLAHMYILVRGAQWLSGRVFDSRPRGGGFEPHRHHLVVSLSNTH